jgi:hypothetical protein
VDRLRLKGRHYRDPSPVFVTDPLCAEAADKIERLEALLAETVRVLSEMRGYAPYHLLPALNVVLRRAQGAP